MQTEYYFGYGMNTNVAGMRRRCPAAKSLGHALLRDWRFRFAHHADVVPAPGGKVHGVLWTITPECLRSLDRLESYPHYYGRKVVTVEHRGREYQAWTYYMQPGMVDAHPGKHYWDCLVEGYQEHGVPHSQLIRAYHVIPAKPAELDEYSRLY